MDIKILTINITGIESCRGSNLLDANVFQDYDAVIANPISLDTIYERVEYLNRAARVIEPEWGHVLSEVNEKRREQASGLLQRGGVIVCFMQPLRNYSYEWRFESEVYHSSISNYDWLIRAKDIDREFGEIIYSKGTTIDYIDSAHPFVDYLSLKPPWTAYVKIDSCENWKVIASAFGTHAISLEKRIGMGYVLLLPSSYDYHNGEILEKSIIKLLKGKEITAQPSWAKSIFVPGQEEISSKITQINERVSALEEERASLIHDNDKLERWKCLLYEKGKQQLEPVVRDALALLGCYVKPQPDKDSDGEVKCDYGNALLEVVGSKGTIKIEKFGELVKNIGNYISIKSRQVKGILVGNPFCEEPLDNRPPKDSQKLLFAKELIESAKQQNITVLLTTDLYEIVSRILIGKLSLEEKGALLEKIFNGKGLVRLD